MEDKKLSFWSRMKIAIAKLEDYSLFIEEKISIAVKYFFLIVLVLVVGMSLVETYTITKMVNKGYNYMQNELPDFTYENGNLNFTQNVTAYDAEYDIYMITDTSENVTEEKMEEHREQVKSQGIIFLKDKAIYRSGIKEIEYKYEEFAKEYGIETLNKSGLTEQIENIGILGIAIALFITLVFGLYIIQVVAIFMDWLVMAIFTHISARICKINMPFKGAFNISIYALTLPILLMLAYNIAYYVWGFYTEYFRAIYLLISYVYIVAAILMIKSDLIKQQVEIAKVKEVQKQVHEELKPENQEEKKENKKPESEDKKEENSDDEVSGEPDGSEI